ncbi:carbamoyltransferase N-terminal domain-containing protein [Pelagicoccus sp. SDUM812002]|uniref:carbamoyltransferase N-terminal domain-containing protein n=1 Tax=Pelagicoccus sp. SDUM812002 TaxID=3041266 RepID=UPI00280DB16B|nr:carbamoyltransferase N-terminal domain-containing protein [Pelagicoccus sp. SDUM812002]MDQ8188551.1 carbamoyltransferase N-terminal domain-containing protein [Pelagicoccus sp. SDUM812002]
MIICGLKLTHDGAVAVIHNGRLVFCTEFEKISNNPRYQEIRELSEIADVLANNGYSVGEVDHFVVDGWGGYDAGSLAKQPRLEIGNGTNYLDCWNQGEMFKLEVAQYREKMLEDSVSSLWKLRGLRIQNNSCAYYSNLHVAGHIYGAYCTSPFARKGEASFVLVWDGGMYPRLYYIDPDARKVDNCGPIFMLIGNVYTIFSQHFGPFKVVGSFAKDDLSIAGKVMAYIAKGDVDKALYQHFETVIRSFYDAPMGFANVLAVELKKRIDGIGYSDETVLRTFHEYLGDLLVEKLRKKVSRIGRKAKNICFAGGCALNIKWNSVLRDSGLFEGIYVPPFPNDSGSAIGSACLLNAVKRDQYDLDWNVYSGPNIDKGLIVLPDGWNSRPFSVEELASLLFESNKPVVFLSGRAELGPRALGHRSILASPISAKAKDVLNCIKKREEYRPVSPICLEDHAASIFEPGSRDPHMLFDHKVRDMWVDRIPAVVHLDNTVRLQTVSATDDPLLAGLLKAFYDLSGIPLLCNTSANFNGCGFFPSVQSAIEWGATDHIWSENILYSKKN